jgi:hypothetical protein
LRVTSHDDVKNLFSSKDPGIVFDLVPGLNINFNPARLVMVETSFKYRKHILDNIALKDSFEFGVDLTSMDGAYQVGLTYAISNRRNNNLGLSVSYRF